MFLNISRIDTQYLCSPLEFKIYLESRFEPWMNWENWGKYNGKINNSWDIDHIIPISNAKTEEDVLRLNHYTNLQPLCSYTNREDGITKQIKSSFGKSVNILKEIGYPLDSFCLKKFNI